MSHTMLQAQTTIKRVRNRRRAGQEYVWETLSDAGITARILRVGMPDRFVTHGTPQLLHTEVEFTPERIAERVLTAVADHHQVA